MSGEAKTVSELCREALELRGNATQGEWYHACESILGGKTHVVFTGLNGDLVERGYDGLLRKSSNATPNAAFTIFAANHIKQIAERCLELEDKVEESLRVNSVLSKFAQDKKVEVSLLKQENQKLRDALSKWLDWEHSQIEKEGPYVGREINDLITQGLEALKGGGG